MSDLDHVLTFLIPIFLAAANGDHAAARDAALKLVESHGAANGEELLLAAEIIALSFATLDSLGKSVGDPTISISTLLRLRSNATALSRAANRNRDALAQAHINEGRNRTSRRRKTQPRGGRNPRPRRRRNPLPRPRRKPPSRRHRPPSCQRRCRRSTTQSCRPPRAWRTR